MRGRCAGEEVCGGRMILRRRCAGEEQEEIVGAEAREQNSGLWCAGKCRMHGSAPQRNSVALLRSS